MRNRKFQNNNEKIKKIKKYQYELISRQNRLEKAEKEGKLKLSFHIIPTRRVIENSKKITKKIKKYISGYISSEKMLEKAVKERENKNYSSVPFLP